MSVSVHLGKMNLSVLVASLEERSCRSLTRNLKWFTEVFTPMVGAPVA